MTGAFTPQEWADVANLGLFSFPGELITKHFTRSPLVRVSILNVYEIS